MLFLTQWHIALAPFVDYKRIQEQIQQPFFRSALIWIPELRGGGLDGLIGPSQLNYSVIL